MVDFNGNSHWNDNGWESAIIGFTRYIQSDFATVSNRLQILPRTYGQHYT